MQALPTAFCQEHLPERDERITLEDEEGHEYSTTYLTGSLCLSAGWRRFANQHKLVDGDCLVFQLIKTTKLKVRVISILHYRMPESSMELARWLIGNPFHGCSEELLPNRLIVVQPMYLSTISDVEVATMVGIVLHQFVLQFAYI